MEGVPVLNLKVMQIVVPVKRYFNEVLLEIKSKPKLKIIFFSRYYLTYRAKDLIIKRRAEIGENHYFISTKDNYLTPDSKES